MTQVLLRTDSDLGRTDRFGEGDLAFLRGLLDRSLLLLLWPLIEKKNYI